MRDIGQEILDGIQEIKQFKQGELALRTHKPVESPDDHAKPRKITYIYTGAA